MSEVRREPPSARRLRQARREGDVALSPLLAAGLSLAAAVLWVGPAASAAAARLIDLARQSFAGSAVSAEELSARLGAAAGVGLEAAAPFLLLAALVGAAVALVQVGPTFSPGLLRPRLERLGPAAAWRAMWRPERWTTAAATLLAAVLVLGAAGAVVAGALTDLARMPGVALGRALTAAASLGRDALAWMAAALVAAGLLDLAWRRHWRAGRLRMTRSEVVEEQRQTEGDPARRGRQRSRHRELGWTALAVDEASVVISGASGEAAALSYGGGEDAPRLLAWGAGPVAARMLSMATSRGVPVQDAPPLAAALRHVRPGDLLPPALWPEAAAVLRSVRDTIGLRPQQR